MENQSPAFYYKSFKNFQSDYLGLGLFPILKTKEKNKQKEENRKDKRESKENYSCEEHQPDWA